MGQCEKCHKSVSRGDAGIIQCIECNHLYHGACLSISPKDLVEQKSRPWICDSCVISKRRMTRKGSTSEEPSGSAALAAEVKELRHEVGNCSKKMDNFMARLEDILGELMSMRKEHSNLGSRVDILEEKVRDINFHEDRKEIEIMGPMSLREDKKYEIALDIMRSSLDVSINLSDIDECFIMRNKGKTGHDTGSSSASGDKLSLIVKLTTGRMRDEIMKNWKQRRGNRGVSYGAGDSAKMIRFRERVSKSSKAILDAAKDVGAKCQWKYVWVRRGRIFMRKADGDNAIWVRSIADLNNVK